MPVVFLGVSLFKVVKWGLRLILLVFWLSVIWLYMNGQDLFGWLAREHVTTTMVLVPPTIFLTVISFMPLFFGIKRTNKSGGETEMRKLAWFAIFVTAIVLTIAVGAALSNPFKAGVSSFLMGVGGSVWVAITNGWSHLTTVASASGTNFLIYTLAALIAGGVLWVSLVRIKDSGRLPFTKKAVVSVPLQSGPSIVPGAVINQPYTPPVQPAAPNVPEKVETET